MTTEVKDVVARARAQMAPLKLAADISRSSADGYTYLNDSARKLLLKLDQSVHELAIVASAAESRATAAEGRVALLEEALDLASNKFGFVAALTDPLNVRAFALGAKKFCDEAIARARLAKGE